MAIGPETRFSFVYSGDIRPIVDEWAKAESFFYRGEQGGFHVYEKGTGMLVAPMIFAYRQDRNRVEAKAWARFNLFVRIASLFILPRQLGIESGGFRGTLPRKIARNAVNRLLERLGQKPIA